MTVEARANLVRVAFGICIAGLGVLLILVQAGTITAEQMVHLWPLALVLVGGAVMWQAMRGGPTTGSDVPIGGIIWLVILGMVVASAVERRQETRVSADGTVSVYAVMSGDKRPVLTEGFRSAQMTAIMGGAELDLRQTPLKPGDVVTIDAFTFMGGGVLRVPADWKVDLQATAIMGGVTDERRRTSAKVSKDTDGALTAVSVPTPAAESSDAPRVIVKGTVVMGGFAIKP